MLYRFNDIYSKKKIAHQLKNPRYVGACFFWICMILCAMCASDSSDAHIVRAGAEIAIPMAIVAGASALGGSAINAFSQASTNRSNRRSVRETNEMNYQIMQEQNEFNKNERLETQEYNTPANQRQRFEDAGINPYFALGQIDGGNATAATAAPPADMKAYQAQAVDYGSILRDGVQSVISGGMQGAQIEQLNLQNASANISLQYQVSNELLKLDNQIADIEEKYSRMDKNSADADVARQRLDNLRTERDTMLENLEDLRATRSERRARVGLENKEIRLRNKGQKLRNKFQDFQNKLAEKLAPYQLQEIQSRIAANFSQANLNNALADKAKMDKLVSKTMADLNIVDKHSKQALQPILEDAMRLANQQTQVEIAKGQDSDFGQNVLSILGLAIGTSFGGAAGARLGSTAGAALGNIGRRPIGFHM